MNFKPLLISFLFLLAVSVSCAEELKITVVRGNAVPRFLTVELNRGATPSELEVLKNPNLYIVTEEPSTNSTPVTPQSEARVLNVSEPTIVAGLTGYRIPISGFAYGKGVLKLNPDLASGVVKIEPADAEDAVDGGIAWIIERVGAKSKLETELSTNFDLETLVGRFAISAPTRLGVANNTGLLARTGDVIRETFSLSGSVPFGKPKDARDAGAAQDSSEQVADFLNFAYEQRVYDGRRFKALGLVARSTGSAKGFEGVLRFVPLTAIDLNQGTFLGIEFEAGYRDGDAEWTGLNQKAPDVGNFVARAGAVLEYMPRIGGINADRTEGLRFFARARGWIDKYQTPSEQSSARFRHFFDAELFYTFSAKYRVFLRAEQGYLPPDLSNRIGRVFVGVGTAF